MDNTKKHKKSSVDFNTIFKSKSINTQSIDSFDNKKNLLLSFRKHIIKLLKNGIKISYFYKRIKKFFYKNFFWGRGVYYKYSILIALILMFVPITVLASSIKQSVPEKGNSLLGTVVDTAYDTGNGKTQLSDSLSINIQSIQSYVVQKGDTVSEIANKFSITPDTLTYTNNLSDNDVLQVGQTLKILPVSGILYKTQTGDTLDSIAKNFNIAKAGYSPQVLLDINSLDSTTLTPGQELLIPGAVIQKPKQSTIVASNTVSVAPSQTVQKSFYSPPSGVQFISPTGGRGHISTCFDPVIHPAVDMDDNSRPPVYASASGVVTYAGWGLSSGSGIAVRIDHQNGYVTEYLHFSQLSVSVGDYVKQGQQLGIMGATGKATGPHVHFVIKYNGVAQNPFRYVDLSKYIREYTATSC